MTLRAQDLGVPVLPGLRALAHGASLGGRLGEDCDPDQVAAAARQVAVFGEIGRGAYSDAVMAQALAIAAGLALRQVAGAAEAARYLRLLAAQVETGSRGEKA